MLGIKFLSDTSIKGLTLGPRRSFPTGKSASACYKSMSLLKFKRFWLRINHDPQFRTSPVLHRNTSYFYLFISLHSF